MQRRGIPTSFHFWKLLLTRADAEERNLLEQVLLSKRYDLLETRTDYLRRELIRDAGFFHKFYLQVLLESPREFNQRLFSGCEVDTTFLLELAVKKRINISKLNTRFSGSNVHDYYATILKTDALDLFLEVEGDLKKILDEQQICTYIIESEAMCIIHYLCAHGMLAAIADDCLIMLKGAFYRQDTNGILAEIAFRHDCVDSFTGQFMKYAPFTHYLDNCALLLQLGAKPDIR